MQRALAAARRYQWVILAVLAVVWGAGLASAYVVYKTTYETQATIWVLRPSPELTASDPNDPGIPVIQTLASQQAELLSQLLKTDSFMRDVVEATSLKPALDAASDPERLLDTVRRRFKVETLGTNMVRVSYAANDPKTPVELVNTALIVRTQRIIAARVLSDASVGTIYQKEFETAQSQMAAAQKDLTDFTDAHPGTLSSENASHQGQLQLAVDFAQARLSELRGRADRAAVSAAVLEMSGLEFQVVDQPREPTKPTGGDKPAMLQAAVAMFAGLLLAAMLVIAGALLADHVAGPADVGRLAPTKLFATVPRVASSRTEQRDLRASLAAIAFEEVDPGGVAS